MAATLPATHLLSRFALFALTVLFLLTMLRAGHALWRFAAIEGQDALLPLFVQGLRFDLALVGVVCLVPVTLGSLLAMFSGTRAIARWLVVGFLLAGLALVLVSELVTPVFLDASGLRPGIAELRALPNPIGTTLGALRAHPVAAGLGIVLGVLILIAFWARLEVQRLLRFPLSKGSALALAFLGGAACLFAIWSGPEPLAGPLSPEAARISDDATVNELVMNSAFKTLATAPIPGVR